MNVWTVVERVARACDQVGVPYYVGGSVASSFHGEARSTNDVDVIADLRAQQVDAWIAALGPDFSVDAEALLDAIRRRSSWNLFYLPDMTKVDVFIRRLGAFERSEFARRLAVTIEGLSGSVYLNSAEDCILRKLLWYREGGESSDRQWRDVVMMLAISGPVLDDSYLAEWAPALGIADLLAKARAAAGGTPEQ